MIPYEIYKILHLFFIMSVLASFSIAFFDGAYSRKFRIYSGIATFFILVSGMGLMARLGIGHGGMWPFWILAKLAVWMLIGVGGPVLIKRFPQYKRQAFFIMFGLFLCAAYFANYKPEIGI